MSCSSSEWSNYKNQPSTYDQTSTISTYITPPPTNILTTSSNNPTSIATPNQPKSTKRKTRASKKAPTTILKAEVSDFRSLVQQLTGRTPNGPISVGAYKGPLNINFGEKVDVVSTKKMMPFGHDTNSNKYDQQHVYKMTKRHEDHIVASRTTSSSSFSIVAPNNNTHACGVGFDHDFDVDDICFQELGWLPSPNGTSN